MINLYKVSKKRTRVTETKTFQGIIHSLARVVKTQGDIEVGFVANTINMDLGYIKFKLKYNALNIPEFYLNGLRLVVESTTPLYGEYDVKFNIEDNSYEFNNNDIKEGDIIELVYETKDIKKEEKQ